jgi:hypothetical protein
MVVGHASSVTTLVVVDAGVQAVEHQTSSLYVSMFDTVDGADVPQQ